MSKGMKDPVLAALKRYEQNPDRNGKKGVLLTPGGGYFLYGNRFCSIQNYELEFISKTCQIQGNIVQKPMFLSIRRDGLHVVGERVDVPELVSLIFHIDLGREDDLLRGILFAAMGEAKIALFCDAAVEELYRLSRLTSVDPSIQIPPDEVLQKQAEELRGNDLHGLTELYLNGQRLKEFQTVLEKILKDIV